MSRRKWAGFATALILVVGVSAYLCVSWFSATAREMLAREQIAIFKEMEMRSLRGSPEEAIGCLRYTIFYYPSGTKQVRGSLLDKKVELERARVVSAIIECLREKTGKDLGDNKIDRL